MTALLKKLNGKTFTIFAVFFVICGLFYFYGCEAKTPSLIDPAMRVTRRELESEIALLNSRISIRIEGLDNQDKLKKMLLDQASFVAAGGTFNPIGALNSLISVLAVGYAVDSRIKLTTTVKQKPLTNPA